MQAKLYSIVFTILFFSTAIFGQDTIPQRLAKQTVWRSAIDTELPRHRWDVSVNLLDLIDKGINPSLFIRRNFLTRDGASRALRFRFQPYFLKANTVGLKSVPSFDLFFAPGYEWQQRSGRFMLFYGTDLWFSYQYSKSTVAIGISGTPGVNSTSEKRRLFGIGADAFLGARYFINHRFSLALESQLIAGHHRLDEEIKNDNVIVKKDSVVDFQVSYTPFYLLNLSYHF
jgi:hypothetical protein